MKKIFNFQFSIFKSKNYKPLAINSFGYTLYLRRRRAVSAGYTLIELVIVMALLIVTGVVIVNILSSTLRGTSKTRITNNLAQNGNYALSAMSNLLLNSQQILSFTPTSLGAPVTDCSTLPVPGNTGKTVTILGFDGGTTTLTCDETSHTISSSSAVFSTPSGTPTPTPQVNSLFDTTQVRLANNNSCLFTCAQQDSYSPPRIDITFQLTNIGNTNNATFNTSVSLRNRGE